MIQYLKLKNFRNFSSKEIFFDSHENLIIWENGSGKTNILEALSLLCGKNILNLAAPSLLKDGESAFFIECGLDTGTVISLSFDQEKNQKKIIINGKAASLQKLLSMSEKAVSFQPIDMNLMYLSPSLRRNFIDETLMSAFPEYEKVLRHYKLTLKNRNSVLKSIAKEKVQRDEIIFWDKAFTDAAIKVYEYIQKFNTYISQHLETHTLPYFFWKVHSVEYHYISKTDFHHCKESIQTYLEKNFERDIVLWTTHIGPHIDDFEIRLDGKMLESFASRGETKSVIIWLKMLETSFTQANSWKKPIVLIDDFLSEIDKKHRDSIIKNFSGYQTILTSIESLESDTIINL